MPNNPNKGMQWLCGAGFIICTALFLQLLVTTFVTASDSQRNTSAIVWLIITGPAALGCFRVLKKQGISEDAAKKVWFAGWGIGLAWAALLAYSALSS